MKLNLASTRLTRFASWRYGKLASIALTLFILFFSTASLSAQGSGNGNGQKEWKENPGQATISSQYEITLDAGEPLQQYYRADISHLSFSNKSEAKTFFKQLNNPAWTIKLAWNEQNIYVILRPNELTRTWSVGQWSQQLHHKAQQL